MAVSVPSHAPYRLALLLGGAVSLTAIGAIGGEMMRECDYNLYGTHSKSSWTASAGYTELQFFGLWLQSVCLPGAAACLMLFAGQSYKLHVAHPAAKLLLYVVVLFLLVLCAALSELHLTSHILECLWAFCFWSNADDDDGLGAYGVVVGVLYFIACLAFAVMIAAVIFKTFGDLLAGPSGPARGKGVRDVVMMQPLVGAADSDDSSREGSPARPDDSQPGGGDEGSVFGGGGGEPWAPLPHREAVHFARGEAARRRIRKSLAVGAVFLVVFPLVIFCDMSYGDDWTDFTVSSIKSYAEESVTQAYGKVWNFRIVPGTLILKLFPDILIFWGVVYIVAIIALLAHVLPRLRLFLHIRVARLGDRTNGELLLWGAFVGLLVGEACYWYFGHGWHSEAISAKTWQERLARTLGQLANVTMALLALPVTRNGVFDSVFGVGWEAMIAYHRVMGYVFLGLIFTHMCLWWKVYAQQGYFGHDWPIAIPMNFNADNFTVPLATVTFWTLLVTHGILAMEVVRRTRFEVFYYAHHFFLVLWIVMLWHAQSAWYYILASLALWAIDRALRFSRGLAQVHVADVSLHGDVVRLSYRVEGGGGAATWVLPGSRPKPLRHGPGQYCFVNIPALSLLEWHPFTISSSPGDEVTTHHIKSMGVGTFTGRLADLAAAATTTATSKGKSVAATSRSHASIGAAAWTVSIDGPYGLQPAFESYDRVVFVAGGIGVTPCHACFRHLAALATVGGLGDVSGGGGGGGELAAGVRLLWASRHVEELGLFADSLRAATAADPRFTADLYWTDHGTAVTGTGGGISALNGLAGPGVACYRGRPDVQRSLADLHGLGHSALVFCCGPAALKRAAKAAAMQIGVDYHEETFEL